MLNIKPRTDNMAKTSERIKNITSNENGLKDRESTKKNEEIIGRKTSFEKELTVQVELEGEEEVTTMELMKCVRELCGGLVACRFIGNKKYEITMSHNSGKNRLMDGFKIGSTRVTSKELCNDELVVSFLGLPAYITDEEILEKLHGWGVSATSQIRRRMWPGTRIADGTRFVKVKFNETVQSLPYSAKFNTATGSEYFRVIHDRQVKVCRICIQPGHILRECPEFTCHKCGVQGHYARECTKVVERCELCHNNKPNCVCNQSETEGTQEESGAGEAGSGSDSGADEEEEEEEVEEVEMECMNEAAVAGETRSPSADDSAASAPRCDSGPEASANSLPCGQVRRHTEAGTGPGEGPEPADLPAFGELFPTAASAKAPGTPQTAPLSGQPSLPRAPQILDSDSEMDLSQLTHIRKRQNTERQRNKNKKSKAKKQS